MFRLFVAFGSFLALASIGSAQTPMTVTAEGVVSVSIKPDQAKIYLTVQSKAGDATSAVEVATDARKALVAAIEKLGVKGTSLTTLPQKITKDRAKTLRRTMSLPEVLLWKAIKGGAIDRLQFRRQHPIGPYVLDFYCAKANLAAEIDGMSHDMGDRPSRDEHRDAWLKKHGVTVMRIAARELMQSVDETADAIVRLASEAP